MYKTFKIYTLTALILISGMLNAQTVRKMTVENGGTGAFKAEIVSDSSLTAMKARTMKVTAASMP